MRQSRRTSAALTAASTCIHNIQTMKIVNFLGGLGNQMFIYALCEHLRTTFPDEKIRGCYRSGSLNIHHGLEIAKVFDVELPPATHLSDAISMMYAACKRMGLTRWENDRHFGRWDVVLDGYWLDRFFYRDKDVKKMFRFRDTHMTGTNRRIEQMMETTEAVALHVRRGDYRSKENMELFGKFCDMEYYNKAIETMRKKVGEPRFFIFSDDLGMVQGKHRSRQCRVCGCQQRRRQLERHVPYVTVQAPHNSQQHFLILGGNAQGERRHGDVSAQMVPLGQSGHFSRRVDCRVRRNAIYRNPEKCRIS